MAASRVRRVSACMLYWIPPTQPLLRTCKPVALLGETGDSTKKSSGTRVKLQNEPGETHFGEEQIRICDLRIARWREIRNGGMASRGISECRAVSAAAREFRGKQNGHREVERRSRGGNRGRHDWWSARMAGGNWRTRYSGFRTIHHGRTDYGGVGWSRSLWIWRRFCRRARQPGNT